MLALALLATAMPTTLPALDEALSRNAQAIARAEMPARDLAAAAVRLGAGQATVERRALLIEVTAVLRGIAPALLGKAASLRDERERLADVRARLVLRDMLARAGMRPGGDLLEGHARVCSDAVWRIPVAAEIVKPRVAALLGHPRGLTLVALPGAAVSASAAARVAYAGGFRRYGGVVILDHGRGWTTLLTGLGRVVARSGGTVRAGDRLATVPAEAPLVGVELSRRGRAVDPRDMLRSCGT